MHTCYDYRQLSVLKKFTRAKKSAVIVNSSFQATKISQKFVSIWSPAFLLELYSFENN